MDRTKQLRDIWNIKLIGFGDRLSWDIKEREFIKDGIRVSLLMQIDGR